MTTRSMALMPMNGMIYAADAVDQQVSAQQRPRPDRTKGDALQGQRDQRDYDQRIKDDRRQDRALGVCKVHDIEPQPSSG